MKDYSDYLSNLFVFFGTVFAFFILIVSLFTNDSAIIKLDVVSRMISKCDVNGGLAYIQHDYDVKCKNGAEFRPWSREGTK